jgi:hypothetical protein
VCATRQGSPTCPRRNTQVRGMAVACPEVMQIHKVLCMILAAYTHECTMTCCDQPRFAAPSRYCRRNNRRDRFTARIPRTEPPRKRIAYATAF